MTAETVADRRLHPSTLFIRFIRKAPEFVLGLPAVIGFASDANLRRILLIALVGAILSFAGSLLAWLRFRYGVGASDIVIETGVLNRQRRIIPFDRVQDIDIEQPLLARLFGSARVKIETGGSGKNEGNLDAISLAEAHRIRDAIRRGGAGAAPDGEAAEPLLFELSTKRLLAAGMFNFSLFYLAVLGGALQYLEPLIKRYVGDPKSWVMPNVERAAAAGLYLTLAFLALLLVLGVITGLVRTVTRDWRFRLTRTPVGFRRRRGLCTLSEVIIPLRRIQLGLVSSGWLRKRLGWHSLEFQTLNAEAQQGGHQSAAPFARLGEIVPLLGEAGLPDPPEEEAFVRVSRRSIARRYIGQVMPIALVAAAASIAWAGALLVLVPLALGGLLVVAQWRRHRYALTPGALFIAEGVLQPRLWILPYQKSQSISVTRSPLQRRLGLASLTVDTAGASILRYPVIRDVEAAGAEALGHELLERYRAARAASRRSPVQVIDAVDERSAEPALNQQSESEGSEQRNHDPAVDRGGAAPGP